MAFKLPRLNWTSVLVDRSGRPNQTFQRWWQRLASSIEIALDDIVTVLGIAQTKNKSFVQATAPTAEAAGDLWISTLENNKLYRWSGSAWVSVRDAGATYALAGLNPDGTVQTDKVNTSSIIDESVSIRGASFTAGSVLINLGSYSPITVQSLTVSTDGEPIILDWCHSYVVSDNCRVRHGIWRGATQLVWLPEVPVSTGDGPTGQFKFVDNPGAGTYTYYVKVGINDSNDLSVANRTLITVELKR